MAKSTDEEFIGELEECLKLAEELEKVDTEDTRLFVSQQLQKLHTFLQTKQIETEGRIEEQIRKEEHEIEDLKNRIARVSQGTGDESDLDYANLDELWHVLQEDYWRTAFYAYIAETTEPADAIINHLLAILKASYDHCKARVEKSRSDIMFQVFYPGENTQQNKNLKLPKQLDQDVVSMCKKCQIRSTPFCLPSIQQAIVRELKDDRTVMKQFNTPQKPLLRALERFVEKCVEFCWIACFEEPEIKLVTNPTKECKALAGKFTDLDRTLYKNRDNAAIVEWPAFVQGENVRVQWQLFTIKQPRPQPDKRRLPNNDYRVIRFENERGREVEGYDLAEDQKHRRDDEVNASTAGDEVTEGGHVTQGRPSEDKAQAPNRYNDKLNKTSTSIIKSDVPKTQEKAKQGGANALREKSSSSNNNDKTKYKATQEHQDEKPKSLTDW